MEIGAGQFGKLSLWTTPIKRISNRAQSTTCKPRTATFISRNRPPTSRAKTPATRIDAAADRTGACDYDEPWRAIRRSIQCDVRVSNDLDLTDSERHQCLAHAFAQLASTCTGKPNLRGNQIAATKLRRRARTVDRVAHSGSRSCNSDSQRVGGSGAAFADHSLASVHDYGFGRGPAAIDTDHRVLRVQASSRREICCSFFGTHSWSSGQLENNPVNIIDYSRVR